MIGARCNGEQDNGTTVTGHFPLRRSVLVAPITADERPSEPTTKAAKRAASCNKQTAALVRVSRQWSDEAAGLTAVCVTRPQECAAPQKNKPAANRLLDAKHFVDRWLLHRQPSVAEKTLPFRFRPPTPSRCLTAVINPVRSSRKWKRSKVACLCESQLMNSYLAPRQSGRSSLVLQGTAAYLCPPPPPPPFDWPLAAARAAASPSTQLPLGIHRSRRLPPPQRSNSLSLPVEFPGKNEQNGPTSRCVICIL